MSWRKTIKEEPQPAASAGWRSTIQEAAPEISELESGLRGAVESASLGFADEIGGGIMSLVSGKPYEQERDEIRQEFQAARDANPKSYMAGQVGGGVATMFVPGLNVAKGATLAARAGAAAGLGATSGVGLSEADTLGGLAQDATLGAAIGGVAQVGGEKLLSPAIAAAGRGADRALQATGQAVSRVAGKVLPKGASFAAGVDEDAARRLFERSAQTAAAEADDFAFKVGRQAVAEADDVGRKAGEAVGQARQSLMQTSGGTAMPQAVTLADDIDSFLQANAPSAKGFSALSDTEREQLTLLSANLRDGATNVEDLLKFRDYMDHVKNLARRYDAEEQGPFINFLKSLRGRADRMLDSFDPQFDRANRQFAQYKDDIGMLRSANNEGRAEAMINNLYGANKRMQQEAAGRLFSPQTMDAAQDIAANKAFEAARRPGGDNYFRRGALAAATFGSSEIVTNPSNWKLALRYSGKIEPALRSNPQVFGKYAQVLQQAAERGPQAIAATHFILSQRDPEYRKLTEQLPEDAK